MKILQNAVAKGNPSEIKRIIGQSIEVMMLDPKECKVVIKKRRGGYPRRWPIEW